MAPARRSAAISLLAASGAYAAPSSCTSSSASLCPRGDGIAPHRRHHHPAAATPSPLYASTASSFTRGLSTAAATASAHLGSDASLHNIVPRDTAIRHGNRAAATLLNGVPRGGSFSAESSSSTNSSDGDVDSSKQRKTAGDRKKKKKRSKPKQTSATDNTTKDDTTDNSTQTSSQSTPSSSTSSTPPLPQTAQSILHLTCHYDILGITRTATQAQIQKAYRRRCLATHPDKLPNGDRQAFDMVSRAYEVLGCERKRALYDRFGEGGVDLNGVDESGRSGGGGSFFGHDVFREFFAGGGSSGASAFFGTDPFLGRRSSSSSSHRHSSTSSSTQGNPFRRPPRNRDLRYNLEVTLEDLYNGTTKHVAIQQPNPLQPHFPLRKEVEVTLSRGMDSGQSVRIAGVVDSIPNCAPADVVFLVSQRRHGVFTRRGYDLAMEVKISLGEALGGWRRRVKCLDGREIVIGPPRGVLVERELVEVDESAIVVEEVAVGGDASSGVNATLAFVEGGDINATATNTTQTVTPSPHQQLPLKSKEYIQLPSTVIQTGDVHVLKGRGMPKRQRTSGDGSSVEQQYGDLYIQYIVETPGSVSKLKTENLNDEERIELARLLCKLEGKDDPTVVVGEDGMPTDVSGDNSNSGEEVNYLAVASGSDFGTSHTADDHDTVDHDEHLRHDEDEEHEAHFPPGFRGSEDLSDFFQRAFAGRSHSSFGGGGSGFHYFSSGGGRGFGYDQGAGGNDDDHKVECNQM